MNAKINLLRNMIETTKNDDTPWIARTIDKISHEVTSILCAPAKLLDNVITGISSLFKK